MRFVSAVLAAISFSVVAFVRIASAGTTSGNPPKIAIFVANGYDVTAYPLGSNGDVPPIAVTTDFAAPSAIARDSSGRLYVTNQVGNAVTVFAANANGNTRPLAVIGGPHTLLSDPTSIALDANGAIYVANAARAKRGSITVYPALSSSGILDESPISEISGSRTLLDVVTGIALDSQGNIYVANELGGPVVPHQRFDVGRVTVYAAGSSGNVAPVAAISGAKTGLASPTDIALDSADNIYVVNQTTANTGDNENFVASITVYEAGSKGDTAPIATIAGDNTALTSFGGIALDATGNIYTSGYSAMLGGATVNIFAAGSNGNVSPITTIFDGESPAGIALDPSRNIYLLNRSGGTVPGGEIVVYAAGSSGDAPPVATIQNNLSGLSDASGVALDSAGMIYVADISGGSGGSIDSYPAGSYATAVPPSATITGPDTQLANPSQVAVDSAGDIFALNFDTVTEYPAGSTGDAVPDAIFTLGGSAFITGLAVNRRGKLYVTVGAGFRCNNKSCHETDPGKLLVWSAGSDDTAGPSTVIAGPNTNLASPSGIAVDRSGVMYVTNQGPAKCTRHCGCIPNGSGSVTVYAPRSNGDVMPTATISGTNTGLLYPYGITLDTEGNVYVLNATGIAYACSGGGNQRTAKTGVPTGGSISSRRDENPVLIFAAGSNGDVAPIASFGGPFTGLNFPAGIAIGPTGP